METNFFPRKPDETVRDEFENVLGTPGLWELPGQYLNAQIWLTNTQPQALNPASVELRRSTALVWQRMAEHIFMEDAMTPLSRDEISKQFLAYADAVDELNALLVKPLITQFQAGDYANVLDLFEAARHQIPDSDYSAYNAGQLSNDEKFNFGFRTVAAYVSKLKQPDQNVYLGLCRDQNFVMAFVLQRLIEDLGLENQYAAGTEIGFVTDRLADGKELHTPHVRCFVVDREGICTHFDRMYGSGREIDFTPVAAGDWSLAAVDRNFMMAHNTIRALKSSGVNLERYSYFLSAFVQQGILDLGGPGSNAIKELALLTFFKLTETWERAEQALFKVFTHWGDNALVWTQAQEFYECWARALSQAGQVPDAVQKNVQAMAYRARLEG